MPFVTTWMQLEIIILSKVKSEREEQIVYDIYYMWNLKYHTNKPIYKQKRTHKCGEQTCICHREVGREWVELGVCG